MNRKTIILALLLFGLTPILVMNSFGLSQEQIEANSRKAMGYIPSWAKVVYGINPQTSFREIGASFYPEFFDLFKLMEGVGINIDRDLQGFYQGNERMTIRTNFVIVVLGHMKPEFVSRLVQQYSAPGYTRASYHGISYYNNAFFGDYSDIYHFSVAYVNNELVLLANSEESLRQAIDLAIGRAPASQSVRGNASLMQYIQPVYNSNLFWMGGFMPEHVKRTFQYYQRLQMFTFVQGIDAVEIATNWNNENLDVELMVDCKDSATAQEIVNFVQAFLPNLAVFTGDDPVFEEIIDSVEITSNNTIASLSFTMSRQQLLRIKTFVDLMSGANNQNRR